VNGRWVAGRRLNGDDSDEGNFLMLERSGCCWPPAAKSIQHFTLYATGKSWVRDRSYYSTLRPGGRPFSSFRLAGPPAMSGSSGAIWFWFFPGRLAGFSWVRSRKLPRRPEASETADSPNLSRKPVSGRQRLAPLLVFLFADQVQLLIALGQEENVHPQQAHGRSRFPIARKSSRISSNSSVSRSVARAMECARVKVEKSE